MLIGGAVGEIFTLVFTSIAKAISASPDNPALLLLTGSFTPSFGFEGGDFILNLYVLKIKFGLGIKINLGAILGIALSSYIFHWYK